MEVSGEGKESSYAQRNTPHASGEHLLSRARVVWPLRFRSLVRLAFTLLCQQDRKATRGKSSELVYGLSTSLAVAFDR